MYFALKQTSDNEWGKIGGLRLKLKTKLRNVGCKIMKKRDREEKETKKK